MHQPLKSVEVCTHCGQPMPRKPGRICGLCHGPIGLRDRWHILGSLVQHVDCANPRMEQNQPEPQPRLLESQ